MCLVFRFPKLADISPGCISDGKPQPLQAFCKCNEHKRLPHEYGCFIYIHITFYNYLSIVHQIK